MLCDDEYEISYYDNDELSEDNGIVVTTGHLSNIYDYHIEITKKLSHGKYLYTYKYQSGGDDYAASDYQYSEAFVRDDSFTNNYPILDDKMNQYVNPSEIFKLRYDLLQIIEGCIHRDIIEDYHYMTDKYIPKELVNIIKEYCMCDFDWPDCKKFSFCKEVKFSK